MNLSLLRVPLACSLVPVVLAAVAFPVQSQTSDQAAATAAIRVTVPGGDGPAGRRPSARNSVSVDTDRTVGPLYNFWSTRPMINANRFNGRGFRESIEPIKSYVTSYNFVRMLGGRNDDQQEYFKGVDANGRMIADFSELVTTMRNILSTGFEPRIVLDNVPWKMSGPRVKQVYGNAKPAEDYDLWRQYINGFMQTLVDEFGMDAVKTWRFRVGTEPNFAPDHWTGTKEEFFRHYDITVDEVLKVVPEAIIGPGNLLTERVAEWDLELIDHCARGRNYATGETGTQMDFFSISYYDKLDLNNVRMNELIPRFRQKLDSYPQFRDIPFDIQEFGVLRDEDRNRGLSLSDASDLGASWYATVADLAYEYGIDEIYDWGQELSLGRVDPAEPMPSGRRHVTTLFQKMEGGERLQSTDPRAVDNKNSFAGVIPVRKDDRLYLLVYNHHTERDGDNARTLEVRLSGDDIARNDQWTMNQWTVDRDHGVILDDLYADVIAAGVRQKPKGRAWGNRPADRFEDGWERVFESNLKKYLALAELPQTQSGTRVEASGGRLVLHVPLTRHCVQLIELTPAP